MIITRYTFYEEMKTAIHDYACEESIDLERRVYQLRHISYRENEQADRITNTGGVNESQSRTPIGADSDTPKARCYQDHDFLAYELGHLYCLSCGKPLPLHARASVPLNSAR